MLAGAAAIPAVSWGQQSRSGKVVLYASSGPELRGGTWTSRARRSRSAAPWRCLPTSSTRGRTCRASISMQLRATARPASAASPARLIMRQRFASIPQPGRSRGMEIRCLCQRVPYTTRRIGNPSTCWRRTTIRAWSRCIESTVTARSVTKW